MQRFRKALPWLLGILIASLLFAALAGYTTFEYSGTDDSPILRSFMGYEGGEPAHFSMLVHTAMAWLLWALAKLFPGVAWFSVFQLFFLWFASAVVVKSLSQCAVSHNRPMWLGTLIGVLSVLSGALFFSCRISFTTTAAWLGAAAVTQLASVDWAGATDRAIRRGLGLGTALLIFCYCLRQVSVVPPLAFWLLGLIIVGLTYFGKGNEKRSLKPLVTGLAVCVGCLLLLSGMRFAETKLLRLDEFYRWQDTSSQLLDYSDLKHITPTDEALADIGWSREEYTLFTYWYFMDDNINSDTMSRLYQSTFQPAPQSISERLSQAVSTVRNAFVANPAETWGCAMGVLAAALCLLIAVLTRPRRLWLWLGAIAAPLLGLALLGYLGWEGRLPTRAMVSVTLPMTAMCLWLLTASLPPIRKGDVRGILCLALCATLLYPAYRSASQQWLNARPVIPDEDSADGGDTPIEADLDEYALENPDTLFIYDTSLVCDRRLFPDTSNGVPGNLMFWGGHPSRSPSWLSMLQKYGITELNGAVFTRDNVCVVSTDPEPWPSLMTYVGQATGSSVDWEYADTYGYLNFFRIYEY